MESPDRHPLASIPHAADCHLGRGEDWAWRLSVDFGTSKNPRGEVGSIGQMWRGRDVFSEGGGRCFDFSV